MIRSVLEGMDMTAIDVSRVCDEAWGLRNPRIAGQPGDAQRVTQASRVYPSKPI